MDIETAKNMAHGKIDELSPGLRQILDNEQFELLLIGSLQTGLYYGPKRALFSGNLSECPFPTIVEADMRLILDETHPHDDGLVERIGRLCGAQSTRKRTSVHWDRTDVPVTTFFWYDDLGNDIAYEWSLSISRRPYVEVATYWHALFTQEERDWQRALRRLATTIDLSEKDYTAFKWCQTREARWRLVASHALAQLDESHDDVEIPIRAKPEPPVAFLVEKWLEGASGYRTMERPSTFLPAEVLGPLSQQYGEEVIGPFRAPPAEPAWVAKANAVQACLKAARAS